VEQGLLISAGRDEMLGCEVGVSRCDVYSWFTVGMRSRRSSDRGNNIMIDVGLNVSIDHCLIQPEPYLNVAG
jgi:hypothetical protein